MVKYSNYSLKPKYHLTLDEEFHKEKPVSGPSLQNYLLTIPLKTFIIVILQY